ncbi:MAG TPA: hypothetical protein VLD37_04695 [Candidatus Bilamarchaeum sp.]|nr:hypothetical protein [Candidatus Bilamarchaeum sp.]
MKWTKLRESAKLPGLGRDEERMKRNWKENEKEVQKGRSKGT